MSIPELFIRRPVATVLVMFGILLVGVAGYRALPVSDLPNVDYPTIQVQVTFPAQTPTRWRPPSRCLSKNSSRR